MISFGQAPFCQLCAFNLHAHTVNTYSNPTQIVIPCICQGCAVWACPHQWRIQDADNSLQ